MRHGTPFFLGDSDDFAVPAPSSDRHCYSSDSQKSSSQLACSYSVATYELGQLMLRGTASLIKRKRLPSEQFESRQNEPQPRPVLAEEEQLVSNSSRYSKRQCSSQSDDPSALQPSCDGLAAVAVLYQWLLHWKASLKALQAKCILTDDVIYRAVDLFIRYREQVQDVSWESAPVCNTDRLPCELAACLWLATKTTGNRSCLPSRTLICRATKMDPSMISEQELEILVALDWHVAFNNRLPEDEESVASMSPASQDCAWPGEDEHADLPPDIWQCKQEYV